jgi:hypothetical protein
VKTDCDTQWVVFPSEVRELYKFLVFLSKVFISKLGPEIRYPY